MTAPSLLILGADVALGVAPATPVQLAHACRAAGYDAVIPATWGEELIAARALERLRDGDRPLVHCSCPLVAKRLSANGTAISPMLLSFVPPPVAAARYLRSVYAPTRLTVTFAGGCAVDGHDDIDFWLSPEALLSRLADRGIDLRSQPMEYDSVLPPDRRRFYSEPGGIPTRAALNQLPSRVELLELEADFVVELGQRLLSSTHTLIDVAPALGCHCIGSSNGVGTTSLRGRIREIEPPRASAPVVDHSVTITLDSPLAAASDNGKAVSPAPLPEIVPVSSPSADLTIRIPPEAPEQVSEPAVVAVEAVPRRTPPGSARPILGAMPQARIEAGRQLPRAYVARRRSSPRGIRESAIRRAPLIPEEDARSRKWLVIAGAGVAAGIALAWLLIAL